MSSCRSHAVHVGAVVVGTRCSKGTVGDALSVQTEADFLGIVLSYWQGARNDLGLVSVVPAVHVRVWIVFSGGLLALQVCVVEDVGRVGSGLAFLQWCWHGDQCGRVCGTVCPGLVSSSESGECLRAI